jgi:hypothetical protein
MIAPTTDRRRFANRDPQHQDRDIAGRYGGQPLEVALQIFQLTGESR